MSPLSWCTHAVRNLVRRKRAESELDAELASYVRLLTDEKMRMGLSRVDAERAARVEAGGMEHVKDEVRDVRAGALVDTTLQDIRYGFRSLRRSAGLTAAAVTALALGIGATTAVFSVVDAVLLRPLPYADADQLVVALHNGTGPVAPGNYRDWRAQNSVFSGMGAAEAWGPNLGGGESPERVAALRVTASIFPLLGVRPLLGRTPLPQEEEKGHEHVVVLGYGVWQRHFAGDPSVLGRTALIDGTPYEIIGVMPREFSFPPFWAVGAEMWAPIAFGDNATSRTRQSLRIFGRLKPGVSVAAAQAQMSAITARLEREFPGTNRNVQVVSLKERVVGNVRLALLVLLGAVGFVLLIACANVAHMLLARASARQKELAVRTALGASRSRVVRQLLTESMVLGALGGAAGIALASLGVRALVSLAPPGLPRLASIALDGRALSFAFVVSLATSAVFGLLPALQAAQRDLSDALRDGDRGSSEGARRQRLRATLVASEFALALVLLVGAGLMIRSFLALQAVDPGFNPRDVMTAHVSMLGTANADTGRRGPFVAQLLGRVRAIPGVQSAGAINHLPITGDNWGLGFAIEGKPAPKAGDSPRATYRVVTPGYFETMRIPITRGRTLLESDREGAPHVVVINSYIATHYWPGEDAVGKRLTFDDPSAGDARWLTVVGVVPNVVTSDWGAPAEAEVYLPYFQATDYLHRTGGQYSWISVVARSNCTSSGRDCDAASLATPIRTAVAAIDRNVVVSEVQAMDDVVGRATAPSRFQLLLLSAFAIVAVALAAVGVYGVMSYTVSRRTHEIGIRLALGATPGEVKRLVIGQGMRVAAIGAAVGLAGALMLTRLMSTMLFGVAATDPLTFIVVPVLLAVVALVATYIPARRAASIDPLKALRSD